MAFKIKNVSGSPFETKGPLLCCTLSPEVECDFCGEIMCMSCGKTWSPRKHFILDMCRSRFSKEEIDAANKCYQERLAVEGAPSALAPITLGECKVCLARAEIGNDRLFYAEEDL